MPLPSHILDMFLASPIEAEQDPTGFAAGNPYAVQSIPSKQPSSQMEIELANQKQSEIAKRAEIEKLLADYESAQIGRGLARGGAGMTAAGMAFGHAFGGEAPDQQFLAQSYKNAETPMQDFAIEQKLKNNVRNESREQNKFNLDQLETAQDVDLDNQQIKKNNLSLDNEEDLRDKSSNKSNLARQLARKLGYEVDDSVSARDILENLPLSKQDQDQIKAARHEAESTKRTGMIQYNTNKRNVEDNATRLASDQLKANYKESIANLRGLELQNKIAERGVHGFKFIDMDKGFIPSQNAAKEAKELSGHYKAVSPIIDNIINTLKSNPRNIWGTDTWNRLKSQYASVAESKNKLNDNGVMNFGDWDHIMMEIGNPNDLNQWIGQGGLTRLEQSRMDTKNKTLARMQQYGYEPGDMKMSGVPHFNAAGEAARGGTIAKPTQESLESAFEATGTGIKPPQLKRDEVSVKTATKLGPQDPVIEPKKDHGSVIKETKSFRQYSDGWIERK